MPFMDVPAPREPLEVCSKLRNNLREQLLGVFEDGKQSLATEFILHHWKEFYSTIAAVLVGMTFIYSILQSLAIYGVLERFLNRGAFFNLLIAFNCFTATLVGMTQVTLSVSAVIDTVYVCYAMEKDTGVISKPEICQAFMLLSSENEAVLAGAVAPKDNFSAS